MSIKTARAGLVAAAFALGSLAAPALAAPLGPNAGLTGGSDGIVSVQYGHGYGHGPRHGFGHHHATDTGRASTANPAITIITAISAVATAASEAITTAVATTAIGRTAIGRTAIGRTDMGRTSVE